MFVSKTFEMETLKHKVMHENSTARKFRSYRLRQLSNPVLSSDCTFAKKSNIYFDHLRLHLRKTALRFPRYLGRECLLQVPVRF